MIFVTTATGELHKRLANNLAESFRRFDWPELIIATDDEFPEFNDLWKGRGLKTRFAQFVPDSYDGPVAFVDADCQAIGEFPGVPDMPAEGMGGIVLQRLKVPGGGYLNFLASTFLIFPSRTAALEVCAAWHAELARTGPTFTDEPALHRASRHKPAISTGWYREPFKNLAHEAVTNPR